jgi:hypothetical protein
MNEGIGFGVPEIKTRPADEPKIEADRGEKTINAQEVLVPVYKERLDPENVLKYMFEKNKYAIEGLSERRN